MYQINILSLINKKYYKYGLIQNLKFKGDNSIDFSDIWITEELNNILSINVEFKDHKIKNAPYPNLILLKKNQESYYGLDHKTLEFFKDNNIQIETIPIFDMDNKESDYVLFKLIEFKNLIDLEKSKAKLDNNGIAIATKFNSNPYDYKLIFKEEIKDIKGIFRLKERPLVFICDDEIKEKIEDAKFTGIEFEKILF